MVTGSVIGSAATALVRTLGSYGIDGRALARDAGVPPDVFGDRHARLSSDILDRFIAAAAEASGDPAFALEYAKQHRAIHYHMDHAMTASDTLVDAWRRLEQSQAFLSETVEVDRVPSSDSEVWIAFTVPEPKVGRWIPTDVKTAMHVLGARSYSLNADLAPLRIELRRPPPTLVGPYDDLFRCPLVFDCERTIVIWDAETAQAPLPMANPSVASFSDEVVRIYIARLKTEGFADRLRQLISAALPDGLPKQSALARVLGVSTRTMARRLADEGTSYRDLIDEVRADLARACLHAGVSITEVAFMVGFAETSSFSRAFRRWTGDSPVAYAAARSPGRIQSAR